MFILFDLLLDASGKSLIEAPLTMRRAALETFFASAKQEHALKLSPYTLKLALRRSAGLAKAAPRLTAWWPSCATDPTYQASAR